MTATSDAERIDENTASGASLLGWAMLIGVGGGLLAVAYCLLLQGSLRLVWDCLFGIVPLSLPIELSWRPGILVVTTVGGLVAGLLTQWLGSAPVHGRGGWHGRDPAAAQLLQFRGSQFQHVH